MREDACAFLLVSAVERESSRQVSRWYGNVVAVNDVTVRIGPGIAGLALPRLARSTGVQLHEGSPTDESLESVFAYLVAR